MYWQNKSRLHKVIFFLWFELFVILSIIYYIIIAKFAENIRLFLVQMQVLLLIVFAIVNKLFISLKKKTAPDVLNRMRIHEIDFTSVYDVIV